MMEAAILTALEWDEPVSYANPKGYFMKMAEVVAELGLKPNLKEL